MPPACPTRCRVVMLLSCGALIGACVTPLRPPAFPIGPLSLDTESVSRMRYAASLKGVGGVAAATAVRTAASQIALLVPTVLLLFQHHESDLDHLELALLECAQRAEREINSEHFGNRPPTSAECRTVVGADACGRPITQAMELGTLKHAHALACMRDVLHELWPGPVSIEQRYRFYPNARFIETVSRAEEQRLIDEDCTHELRGTIKPDVVLHSDRDLLRAVVILDLKFPCPPGNTPGWPKYEDTSPYSGFDQKQLYQRALDGAALILSPRGIFK